MLKVPTCVSLLMMGNSRNQTSVTQLAAALLALSAEAAAANAFGQTFDMDHATEFDGYKGIVGAYIQKRKPHVANHACVLGQIAEDHSKVAWVLWEQGGELILYETGTTELSQSRRRLNLNKHVVANEADLHGSTYLITRDWLSQLRAACRRHGNKIRIAALKSPVPHTLRPKMVR